MQNEVVRICRYDTLGPDAVGFICGHAELSAVACSAEVLGSLLEALNNKPNIKLVVSNSVKHRGEGLAQGCTIV